MKKLLWQNRYFFSAFLVLLLGGALLLLLCTKETVTWWVNKHYSVFGDYFFRGINAVGTAWFSVLVLLVLWIRNGRQVAFRAMLCFLSSLLVVLFLKHVIFPGTPRPTLYFGGEAVLRLLEGVNQLQTESFPSGHTAAAFSIATFLSLLLPVKKCHWIFAVAAACVGYARIYLSQHFITDVYAGMIIGVCMTVLVYCVFSLKAYFR